MRPEKSTGYLLLALLLSSLSYGSRVRSTSKENFVTLLVEVKKELRRLEQIRKDFETKAANTKRMEERLRQLAVEFGGTTGAAPKPGVRKPMSEEHRRKISEALKRRFAK